MNPAQELLDRLDAFLDRRTSLREIHRWLAGSLGSLLDSPDSLAGRLTVALELSVADIQDGVATERQVRASLRSYRQAQNIFWAIPRDTTRTVTTASTSQLLEGGWWTLQPALNNVRSGAGA